MEVEGGLAFSWEGGGTLSVTPAGDERPGVRALVFRDGEEHAAREEAPILIGPATTLILGPSDPWPR
jgi:hypothetical protein